MKVQEVLTTARNDAKTAEEAARTRVETAESDLRKVQEELTAARNDAKTAEEAARTRAEAAERKDTVRRKDKV